MGQIPLAAVDRIEILKGGASAIYASDAVAGVVNIITRKNWEGLNVAVEGQTTDRLDLGYYNINAAFGAVGKRARLSTAVSWDLHDDLGTKDRSWTAQGQLESQVGYPGTFLVGAGRRHNGAGSRLYARGPAVAGDHAARTSRTEHALRVQRSRFRGTRSSRAAWEPICQR
jgi:outer membrane receptor protein involved in Fe transport